MKAKRILPIVPVIVDLLAGLLVVWLLPTAVSQFSQQSASNATILIIVFIPMCVGVFIVRQLEARKSGGKLTVPLILLNRNLHIASAIAFTLSLVIMLTFQLGYLNSFFKIDTLSSGESAILGTVASLIGLAIPFIYAPVLLRKAVPTIKMENGRYPWLASLALLLINLMLLLVTAQLAAWINLQNLRGDWLLGLTLFALLALIFGPPRWIYLSKQPDIGGDLTALALWGVCTWQIMA